MLDMTGRCRFGLPDPVALLHCSISATNFSRSATRRLDLPADVITNASTAARLVHWGIHATELPGTFVVVHAVLTPG